MRVWLILLHLQYGPRKKKKKKKKRMISGIVLINLLE